MSTVSSHEVSIKKSMALILLIHTTYNCIPVRLSEAVLSSHIACCLVLCPFYDLLWPWLGAYYTTTSVTYPFIHGLHATNVMLSAVEHQFAEGMRRMLLTRDHRAALISLISTFLKEMQHEWVSHLLNYSRTAAFSFMCRAPIDLHEIFCLV